MPVINRVRMEIWPVKQQLYAVMVLIKSKSVVEVQRRFRHEFCLEGMQEYHPLTVFCIGHLNLRILAVFAIVLLAGDTQSVSMPEALQGDTSHDLKAHLI